MITFDDTIPPTKRGDFKRLSIGQLLTAEEAKLQAANKLLVKGSLAKGTITRLGEEVVKTVTEQGIPVTVFPARYASGYQGHSRRPSGPPSGSRQHSTHKE